MGKFLSIVIPVYNESENLGLLNGRIKEILSPLNIDYEVIYVDDGSNDDSYNVLKNLSKGDENIRVLKFKKNFGQTAAMSAGFDYAKGELIVSLDADLQNDPKDIPQMINKYNEGYDIVSGWRKKRKDNIIRNFFSQTANKLIAKLTGIPLHDYGCTLKIYNAKLLKSTKLYGEQHRFIPAIADFRGAKVTEMEVSHNARKFGKSKYNLSRTPKVILDLLTIVFFKNFITKPMHFFGKIALLTLKVAFFTILAAILCSIFKIVTVHYSNVLIFETLLVLFSLQCLGAGLIAEIFIRIYFESGDKKIYTIDETLNIKEN